MNYKIDEIEGIGPAYAQKLRKVGIKTTGALLKRASDARGRKALADATGLSDGVILKWVNMADLLRVRGVGGEYAELLEKAGVDTIKELRHRNPDNLHARMVELNRNGHAVVRRVPSLRQVHNWIGNAQEIAPAISY